VKSAPGIVQHRVDAAAQSDADVIAASRDNPEVFRLIVSRHGEAVYKYAARRVGIQDAQDVASEVFLRGFRLRARYEGLRETCLPWLYRIARNVIGEWLKKANRDDRVAVVLHPPAGGFEDDVLDRVAAESVVAELREALELLADRDRETLLLFAVDGLTYGEIAASLHIPPGTVGSRLTRARNDIRAQVPDLERKASLFVKPVAERGEERRV
jgi:RNA polymerase sigma-70 factor (ECF subfamily)